MCSEKLMTEDSSGSSNIAIKNQALDMFYTKPAVALECYNIVKKILKDFIDIKTFWVEPSAGSGSFLNIIEGKKIGFDINPKNENILKLDFLRHENILQYFSEYENIITIGNPPFGSRAKKAIDFFNKSAEFSSHIAFILPNQFKKYSAQSKLNSSFKLIHQDDLDENSFLVDDKDYKIRCVFQIWTRIDTGDKDIRIVNRPEITHKDFEIFQYNNTKEALKFFDKETYKWDFAVPRQGFYDYNTKITDEKDLNTKIQWAFFKAKNKKILARLKKIDFEKLAKNNTIILGFGKHDVIKEYIKLYEKNI